MRSCSGQELQAHAASGEAPDQSPHGWRAPMWLFAVCVLCLVISLGPFAVLESVGVGRVDASIYLRQQYGFYRNLTFGHLLPTWIDTANAGFGNHVLQSGGRGAHYFMALFTWLGDGDAWFGLRFGSIAALLLGGGLAYRVGRLFWGRRESALVGVLHMLGPYGCFILSVKSSLIEAFGLAIAPWIIERAILLVQQPSPRRLAILVLSYVYLINSHLPVAFVLGGLLVLLALSYVLTAERRSLGIWLRPLWVLLAAALSVAGSSFYWSFMLMGSLRERIVTFKQDWSPGFFHGIFTADCWAIPDIALPLCYIAVGVLALALLLSPRGRVAIPSALWRFWPGMVVTLVAVLLVQTSWALPLWRQTGLWCWLDRYYRFDAAVQLPVVLMLVGCGQALLSAPPSGRRRRFGFVVWAGACGLQLLFAAAVPWYVYASAGRTIAQVRPYDPRAGDYYAVYYPSTAYQQLALEQEYNTDWKLRGPGVQDLHVLRWAPQHKEFSFASSDTLVDIRQFHYEGWHLEVDGQPAPSWPGEPYGQIQFEVPAGSHHARLTLVWPGASRTGASISLAVACVLLGLLLMPASWAQRSQPGPGGTEII